MDQAQTSDANVLPTVFVNIDEYGQVKFGVNTEELAIPMAIAMLEIAKQKMASIMIATAHQEAQAAEASKPQIVIPQLQIAPKRN